MKYIYTYYITVYTIYDNIYNAYTTMTIILICIHMHFIFALGRLQIVRKCLRSNDYYFLGEKCQNASYDNLNMCMIMMIIQWQSFRRGAINISNCKCFIISDCDIVKYFCMKRQTFVFFEKYYFHLCHIFSSFDYWRYMKICVWYSSCVWDDCIYL